MPTKKNVTARKPSARKRTRQIVKARARNFSDRTQARGAIKKARLAIEKTPEQIKEVLAKSNSVLDKTAQKKVIHRNKAARLKSRLAAQAKKVNLSAQTA